MKRAVIALLFLSMPALAADHREAAKSTLPALGELARLSPGTAGLTSAEAAAASIDEGIRVMLVGLRDLRTYEGGDPRKLLIDAGLTLHAVRVGGVLKSEITIAATAQGPRPVEIGRTWLIRQFERARGSVRGGEFLVQVPALHSYFVARDVQGKLMLTPMHDNGELKLGKELDAEAVLRILAKEAQGIGDDDLT